MGRLHHRDFVGLRRQMQLDWEQYIKKNKMLHCWRACTALLHLQHSPVTSCRLPHSTCSADGHFFLYWCGYGLIVWSRNYYRKKKKENLLFSPCWAQQLKTLFSLGQRDWESHSLKERRKTRQRGAWACLREKQRGRCKKRRSESMWASEWWRKERGEKWETCKVELERRSVAGDQRQSLAGE